MMTTVTSNEKYQKCIDICLECANFSQDHCKHCADICNRCATECETMSK